MEVEGTAGQPDESKLKNHTYCILSVESPSLPGLVVLGIVRKRRESRGIQLRIPIFFLAMRLDQTLHYSILSDDLVTSTCSRAILPSLSDRLGKVLALSRWRFGNIKSILLILQYFMHLSFSSFLLFPPLSYHSPSLKTTSIFCKYRHLPLTPTDNQRTSTP